MNIDEEFEKFIEFPGDSKNHVTSVSAKLFAKHCVDQIEAVKIVCTSAVQNAKIVGSKTTG